MLSYRVAVCHCQCRIESQYLDEERDVADEHGIWLCWQLAVTMAVEVLVIMEESWRKGLIFCQSLHICFDIHVHTPFVAIIDNGQSFPPPFLWPLSHAYPQPLLQPSCPCPTLCPCWCWYSFEILCHYCLKTPWHLCSLVSFVSSIVVDYWFIVSYYLLDSYLLNLTHFFALDSTCGPLHGVLLDSNWSWWHPCIFASPHCHVP